MPKRPSYEIRNKILMMVKEKPLSYSELSRKIDTNYDTITNHCKELEKDDFVKITKIEKDPSNGRPSYKIAITPSGIKRLKR